MFFSRRWMLCCRKRNIRTACLNCYLLIHGHDRACQVHKRRIHKRDDRLEQIRSDQDAEKHAGRVDAPEGKCCKNHCVDGLAGQRASVIAKPQLLARVAGPLPDQVIQEHVDVLAADKADKACKCNPRNSV